MEKCFHLEILEELPLWSGGKPHLCLHCITHSGYFKMDLRYTCKNIKLIKLLKENGSVSLQL